MNVKDSGQSVSFLEFSREEKSDTFYPTVAFQTPSPPPSPLPQRKLSGSVCSAPGNGVNPSLAQLEFSCLVICCKIP